MSVITREREDIDKVFDDLYLSRKPTKKAEGTQTPPRKEVPGEVPDECVSSLIEILTPSLRQHHSSRNSANASKGDGGDSSSTTELEEEITVNRSNSKMRRKQLIKDDTTERKEVFEELCLSRKKSSVVKISQSCDLSSADQSQELVGEVPDENVSSMIEMLSPSIRPIPKKNCVSPARKIIERNAESKEKVIRGYQSEPAVGPVPNIKLSSTMSQVSLDSIFTTPTNLTDSIDDSLIKTLLSSHQQYDKGFVEAGSNTETSSKHSKRKNKKKRRKSKVKLIKDSGTDTIYQTEDSTNQTEDLCYKETEELLKDSAKSATNIIEVKEKYKLCLEAERIPSREIPVRNDITVLRNRTDWTETPFLPQDSSETTEETITNVDSEPTRGCPSALQYKIQFNSADKNSSNTKTGIKRFKAIFHTAKRSLERNRSVSNEKKDFDCPNFFSKPITNICSVNSPADVTCLDKKIQERMFPSHSSFNSRETSTNTSLTSISCSTCFGEEKLGNCCCSPVLTDTSNVNVEPKVFWAITKINVYPDNSRTYEVMPLTGKKPAELPEKSDSVFVLIPPKPGQFVPSNSE